MKYTCKSCKSEFNILDLKKRIYGQRQNVSYETKCTECGFIHYFTPETVKAIRPLRDIIRRKFGIYR